MAEQLCRERLRREMIYEIIGTARLLPEKGGASAISVRAIARQAAWPGSSVAGRSITPAAGLRSNCESSVPASSRSCAVSIRTGRLKGTRHGAHHS